MERLFDFSEDFKEPKIVRAYNQDELDDNPSSHRWRASWYNTHSCLYHGREVVGIQMTAYPVVRATPCGAWIAQGAFRDRYGDSRLWTGLDHGVRWVSNQSGASFAKPTQELALHSIAYRLMRWRQKTVRDVKRLREAAFVCKALLPDLGERYAKGIDGPF